MPANDALSWSSDKPVVAGGCRKVDKSMLSAGSFVGLRALALIWPLYDTKSIIGNHGLPRRGMAAL
jgi:hypothetical protein